MLFVLACAFRPPAEPPRLDVARAPIQVVTGFTRPGVVSVVVRAGSAYDPPGREGLAWMAAHAVAGTAEVDVGPEIVRFDLPASELPSWRARLAEPATLVAPAPATDCETVATDAWDTWALAGHPYGHPVSGRRSVVPTLTAAEVRSFVATRYVREAVRIGAIEALDTVALDLPTLLSPRVTPTVPPRPTSASWLVVEAPVAAPCLAIGRPDDGPRTASEDKAIDALAVALGGEPDAITRVEPMFRFVLPLDGDALALRDRVASQRTLPPPRSSLLRPMPTSGRLAAEALLPGLPKAEGADLPAEAETTAILARLLDASRLRTVVVVPDASAYRAIESADPPAVQTAEDLFR